MNGMGALGGFGVLFSGLFAVASGLMMVGLGQAFEALKEIAINTRAMAASANPSVATSRSTYGGLGFITAVMTIIGALTVIGGILTSLGGFAAMMR